MNVHLAAVGADGEALVRPRDSCLGEHGSVGDPDWAALQPLRSIAGGLNPDKAAPNVPERLLRVDPTGRQRLG